MPQERVQNVVKDVLPDSDYVNVPMPKANHAVAKSQNKANEIVGRVMNYSNNNKKVCIEVKDKANLWIHVSVFAKKLRKKVDLRKDFPIGTEIVVKDIGKDENGYQTYEYIR